MECQATRLRAQRPLPGAPLGPVCTVSLRTAIARKERQPPRAALLADRQGVPHQIALADDADDASVRGDDWDTTDALGVQDLGNLWDRGLGSNRDDLARHDISNSQQGGTSSIRSAGVWQNQFQLSEEHDRFPYPRTDPSRRLAYGPTGPVADQVRVLDHSQDR